MTCTHCESPAIYFCQAHRRYMCGNQDCAGYHRLAFRPDFCRVVDAKRWEPMDWVIAIGSVIVFVVGIAIAAVHL